MAPFRPYQRPVFDDRHSKVALLHWSRQVGKSYTLAAWGVDRCLVALAQRRPWLVTVLSNSKDNGGEFALKAAEWARKIDVAAKAEELPSLEGDAFRFEVRICLGASYEARLKVLPANPRTARGFSGDLILDEFAYHPDDNAIWDAAEPIISSNPEYLCRISSTGNGRRNLFYRMCSSGKFVMSRWRRSELHARGWIPAIVSSISGKPITPAEAREEAIDKASYDQNYECAFENEAMGFLTDDQVSAIETLSAEDVPILEVEDGTSTRQFDGFLEAIHAVPGRKVAGWDFARSKHQSVCAILADDRMQPSRLAGALLMRGISSPKQARLVKDLPLAKSVQDAGGNGLGAWEILVEEHGWRERAVGLNFACSVPTSPILAAQGVKTPSVPLPARLATHLTSRVVSQGLRICAHPVLHADLIGPQRVFDARGVIRVDLTEDSVTGSHCDWFWALAMGVYAEELLELGGAWTAEALQDVVLPDRDEGARVFHARTMSFSERGGW
jgi:phage FluMu gp28-like protein